MSVSKRLNKDGKVIGWQAQILTHDPHTGARKRITVGTYARKRDAEAAERDALTKRERGTLLDPATTTVAELLDAWLDTKRGQISANSLNDYTTAIRLHLKPALGSVRIQALKADKVQAQYNAWRDAGMSARQIRGCGMRLSQALDYAVRVNLVYTNVAKLATLPKISSHKPDVWNRDEAATFLAVARTSALHPLWHLLLLEGMRRGEALGLRWQDINWERGTAHLVQTVTPDKSDKGRARIQQRTKTAAGARTVLLNEETLAELRAHRDRQQFIRQQAGDAWQDHGLVICTRVGTPVQPGGNVQRAFTAIVKRAGLRSIRVHDLRHTHATLLLLAGVPAKVVSERLGHASIGITLDTYSHVLPDMQAEATRAIARLLPSTGSDA